MDDYVHNLKKFLSEGQVVKAKILSIDDEGKLNLSLKDNDYFKIMSVKKKQSVLDEIRETEKYGFQTLKNAYRSGSNSQNVQFTMTKRLSIRANM